MPGQMKMVNQQFLQRVKPQFLEWGLVPHPNPAHFFGWHAPHYRYDFADWRDPSNIRFASFAIFQKYGQLDLWIRGLKAGALDQPPETFPLLSDNIPGLFTLTRQGSRKGLFRFFKPLYWRMQVGKSETTQQAAERFIDDLLIDLPLLHRHIYR